MDRQCPASPNYGFDYSKTIFGDEPALDIRHRRWGSLRMKRCLASLRGVTGFVLEIGCGAGRVLKTIHRYRPDLQLCGCDISEPALERARTSVPAATFKFANAAALPYGDRTFDVVVVMDLLEHVVDPSAVLGEIARVLKPRGVMHLHVPCEGEAGSLYRYWLRRGVDMTAAAVGHLHHFRRAEVRQLLSNARFQIRREWNSMYPLAQLHDMIGWRSMIQRQAPSAVMDAVENRSCGGGITAGAVLRPQTEARRDARSVLWKLTAAISPSLLYWETIGLGWQPFGGIGMCLTATSCN